MNELFGYVKPPIEELRDLLPGTDGFDFGAAAAFPDTLPGGSAVTGEAGTMSGRSGQPAPQVKAEGIRPPASSVLTFSLTEAQRSALSFAALCEAEELAAGREAHEPEVQEAIRHLWEARRILEGAAA